MTPSDTTHAPASPGTLGPPQPQADSTPLSVPQLLRSLGQGAEAAGGPPPGLSAAPTFAGLAHALRRRWLIAAVLALAALVLGIGTVFVVMPPKYAAQVRFRVMAQTPVSPVGIVVQEDPEFLIFKANQQALLASPMVLSDALKGKLPGGRPVRDLGIVKERGMYAIDWLEKTVKSDYNLGPEMLRATLSADDPEEVALLLNAIATAYLERNRDTDRTSRERRLGEYRTKREEMEAELGKLRGRLNERLKNQETLSRETTAQKQQQAMADLSAAKSALRANAARRDELQTELAGLEAKLKLAPKIAVPDEKLDEALNRDPLAAPYFKQLLTIQTEAEDYARTAVDAGPHLRRAAEKARQVQKQLDGRREQIRPEVAARYRAKLSDDLRQAIEVAQSKMSFVRQQEKTLQLESGDLEKRVRALDPRGQNKPEDVLALEGKVENTKAALDEISRKLSLVEFETPRPRVTLLQEATPPNGRDCSRQIKYAGAGGLGALGLVLFGVALLEFRARKISVADEIEQGLGLSVVGALPNVPEPARRPLTAAAAPHDLLGQGQLNEAIDAVRTLLLHTARTESLRVIMVTSADGGEGKTSVATQLAASLARAWRRVLLIDGDLRHPATHTLYDLPSEPGLSEVLRGEVEADDAIRATPLSRLWLLPAGRGDAHALQALAQDDVRALIERLKQQYDFLIVDAPPVLPVTDALLLGQHVDGVLFSILRDVSRAPAVHAARQKLAPLGIRTLGAVMVGAPDNFGGASCRYLAHQSAAAVPVGPAQG